jgi:integrase
VPEALSDRRIKELLAERPARVEIADAAERGLRIRVTGDRAVWFVWYRTRAGQARRFRLGRYPGLTLSKARKAARNTKTDIDRGLDPQATRREQREAQRARRAALRVSDLCDLFVKDQKPRWRLATAKSWERYIAADIKPTIGKRLVTEIGPDELLAFLDALAEKRKPTSVSYCFEVARRIWSWAYAKRKVRTSPFLGLKVGDTLRKPQERSRIYSDAEVRAILTAAPSTDLSVFVPLVFETAARQQELRSMRWADIDLEARVWTVPAESSKTRMAHRVPLTKRAAELLEGVGAAREGYVFPGGTSAGHVGPAGKAMERLRKAAGLPDLRTHDIRRTVRQRLADLGVDERTAESILGHRPPKLVRTYVPEEPIERMRAALDRWSRHLAAIVAGETRAADVLPFVGPA